MKHIEIYRDEQGVLWEEIHWGEGRVSKRPFALEALLYMTWPFRVGA